MSISKCLASLRLFIHLCAITSDCFIGSTVTLMQWNSGYECMCYLIGKVIGEQRPRWQCSTGRVDDGRGECTIAPLGWWENWTICLTLPPNTCGEKKNPVKDVCVVLYVPSCIMFIQLFYFIRITQDRNAYGINSSPKNDTSKCHNLLKQCSMPLFDHEFSS